MSACQHVKIVTFIMLLNFVGVRNFKSYDFQSVRMFRGSKFVGGTKLQGLQFRGCSEMTSPNVTPFWTPTSPPVTKNHLLMKCTDCGKLLQNYQ